MAVSREDYLKAAEIMARCDWKNIDFVVHFLKLAGVCDEEFLWMVKKKEVPQGEKRGRRKNIDPDFVALLNRAQEEGLSFYVLSAALRIQRQRIEDWANGLSGITYEKKQEVTEFLNNYLKAREVNMSSKKA